MISRSELGKRCGVSKRTLEHYASDAGYHILDPIGRNVPACMYQDESEEQLRLIIELKSVGFSLKQIHEYQIANQEMRVQMLRRQVPVLEGRKEEIQGELNRLLGMLEAEQKKVNQ
ncbi:MAG: MerR family transcriptional regulator [Lachnospiraceae bacterium]|nr:MerR family transcriptional regulator [Lachnospiraceae bacterium]